jgi:hypothetical protein
MPCIYTVVRKVGRYETQASSKAQLIHVADVRAMSALPPKADIAECDWDVRFVPKADIAPYSIISSARADNVGGTSMPSALAVLRLITNFEFGRLHNRQVAGLGGRRCLNRNARTQTQAGITLGRLFRLSRRRVPSTLARIAIMHGQCGFLIEIKCRACLQLYRSKHVVVRATMRKGVLHGYP